LQQATATADNQKKKRNSIEKRHIKASFDTYDDKSP